MQSGEKGENPRRFLPPSFPLSLSAPMENTRWDITRMHNRVVTVLIFFRSPRGLWARRYYSPTRGHLLHVFTLALMHSQSSAFHPFFAFHFYGRTEQCWRNVFHEELGQAFWSWTRENDDESPSCASWVVEKLSHHIFVQSRFYGWKDRVAFGEKERVTPRNIR